MADKYFYRIENGVHELVEEGEVLTFAKVRGRVDLVKLLCGLRPEVLAFAKLMEENLRKHDAHKGQSWKKDNVWPLYARLGDEENELYSAIKEGKPEEVAKEAADVANFAMMIADVVGGLKP